MQILMYHSITRNQIPAHLNAGGKHIDYTQFERQVEYLSKKNYISINQVKSIKNNGILITFDDGFQNNYTAAFPLLRKYKIPFVLFISTGFMEGKLIWTDELLKLSIVVKDFFRITGEWFSSNNIELDSPFTYNSLRIKMKSISDQLRKKFLNEMLSEKQNPLPSEFNELFTPLTWEQLQEMVDSGLCEIGAHTETHPILSQLSYDQQFREISLSKQKFEDELDREVSFFAYPNGKYSDFNDDTLQIVENLGFKYAFSTESGKSKRADFPYKLRRYGITSDLPFWKFKIIANGWLPNFS
jgi:peptidoglycan/xylan/chitin deacetylase (PgdA/CDA1 family)